MNPRQQWRGFIDSSAPYLVCADEGSAINSEHLLVVEDDDQLMNWLCDALRLAGYQVRAAANGIEAAESIKEDAPSLILFDIAMPQMDGYALLKAVRAQAEWRMIPFVFLIGHDTDDDQIIAGKLLGANDYLLKPVSLKLLIETIRIRLISARQRFSIQMQQAWEASLTVLANAIEVRDQNIRHHVERVAAYALAIGLKLGRSSTHLDTLRLGAILHDIGKIQIQESLLAKSGPLSGSDWEELKKHPVSGERMVSNIPFLVSAKPIIRHHHERWDGEGYPDGLKENAIPLLARIVAVADSFDAMTTERSYRSARSPQDAHDEIVSCSGHQYDPTVVEAFREAWDAYEIQPVAAALEILH